MGYLMRIASPLLSATGRKSTYVAWRWRKVGRGVAVRGITMRQSIDLMHQGRQLSIHASVSGGDWQIWFYEAGHRIYLYGELANEDSHQVEATLKQARRDLLSGAIIVPTVRFWSQSADAQAAAATVEATLVPGGAVGCHR
jgi:hypothetical protein